MGPERRLTVFARYCPVCEHYVTKDTKLEADQHVTEHVKMQNHRENHKEDFCDCK